MYSEILYKTQYYIIILHNLTDYGDVRSIKFQSKLVWYKYIITHHIRLIYTKIYYIYI